MRSKSISVELPFSVFISFFLIILAGCAGGGSSTTVAPTPPPPPASITVTVSPATATVRTGTVFSAFVATVSNTSNTAVNWLVDTVAGGNNSVGTIDPGGHYTAPSSPGNHTVTAVSQADTS